MAFQRLLFDIRTLPNERDLTVLLESYHKRFQDKYDYLIWLSFMLFSYGVLAAALSFLLPFWYMLFLLISAFLSFTAMCVVLKIYTQGDATIHVIYFDREQLLDSFSDKLSANSPAYLIWLCTSTSTETTMTAYCRQDILAFDYNTVIHRQYFKKIAYDVATVTTSDNTFTCYFPAEIYQKELHFLHTYLSTAPKSTESA